MTFPQIAGMIHTPHDVLYKDFKSCFYGYNPQDVDTFLDEIVADYNTFAQSIINLQKECQQLQEENNNLKKHQPHIAPAEDILKTRSHGK